uniref:ARAD1D50028p n=1 Tax=Blastobotrys adeninivorans TaxID=409370 RepID=A0A060TE94_BLAAD
MIPARSTIAKALGLIVIISCIAQLYFELEVRKNELEVPVTKEGEPVHEKAGSDMESQELGSPSVREHSEVYTGLESSPHHDGAPDKPGPDPQPLNDANDVHQEHQESNEPKESQESQETQQAPVKETTAGLNTAADIPDVFAAAGNETLGFHKIAYINLPHRFDYDDSMRITSTVSNVTVEKSNAVDGSILESGKGLPPSSFAGDSSHVALRPGELACFRSHANLWSQMIQENWESLLILEADAVWDVNIRQINRRMAKALSDLVIKYNMHNFSRDPTDDTPWGPRAEDPFDSHNWDVITLGGCDNGGAKFDQTYLRYDDPDAPLSEPTWREEKLVNQRVIRQAGYMVCTTAYAVSQRGARKLLLRAALDSNLPIDTAMAQMMESGELKAFAVWPPTFYTWVYPDGTGGESAASEIQTYADHTVDHEVWKDVYDHQSIWGLKYSYKEWPLRHNPFEAYSESLYGNDIKAKHDQRTNEWLRQQKEKEEREARERKERKEREEKERKEKEELERQQREQQQREQQEKLRKEEERIQQAVEERLAALAQDQGLQLPVPVEEKGLPDPITSSHPSTSQPTTSSHPASTI